MNLYRDNHQDFQPDFLYCQPSATTTLPSCVEAGNYWQVFGSGVGWGDVSFTSAFGEYLERKHFYLDIQSTSYDQLRSSLSPQEVNEFILAFSQTSHQNIYKNALLQQKFKLSRAWRIVDFTPCNIPTVCISLSPLIDCKDDNILPNRDTCGCCIHQTIDKAILGSIKELLERQFLLRFWLTDTCRKKIKNTQALEALKKSYARNLFEALSNAGELCILDISDTNFPGICILIVYGSPDKYRSVKYCAGMSYSECFGDALEKSILELWQTYRFMNNFVASNQRLETIKDHYLRHFLSCNNYDTYLEVASSSSSPSTSTKSAPLTLTSLIDRVRSLSLNGYIYIESIPLPHKSQVFASKYISPNLFLHMNNASNINHDNSYSAQFKNTTKKHRQEKMVPFP
ncbi:YcaO-like family protein [Pseudomonas sp. B21-012]|uniref:YcaO-like family protein n=1 Tax=Pseudomonas sp. B21-012 TaxID=2895472 RepID=UPI00215F5213|nr:YcaO-like family protein [Pseudomonas sp. B21-012]UVM54453.1 YcaO-like family protein [Pseudomonas sp. B21-012]